MGNGDIGVHCLLFHSVALALEMKRLNGLQCAFFETFIYFSPSASRKQSLEGSADCLHRMFSFRFKP